MNCDESTDLEGKKLDFLFQQSEYFHRYINVADIKATWIFTITGAAIVYNLSILGKESKADWIDLLCGVAIGLLVFSAFFCFSVVMPRLGGDSRGLIYFNSVASRKTSQEFSREFEVLVPSKLVEERCSHNYELAKICRSKFQGVQSAGHLGVAGMMLTALVVFASQP